jgi:hypothetical protein
MTRYLNRKTFAMCLAVGLLACNLANAQYAADFEDPPFTGSPDGTIMTDQDGFYIPPDTVSTDFLVYTYAGNALGVPNNPGGDGDQFVAGTGPAGDTYARAQRDIDWGDTEIWEVSYDVLALYLPDDPNVVAANNVGSFSIQPYDGAPGTSNYIHLFSWVTGQEGVLWQAFYMMYSAAGVADGQPGRSPGPEWENLILNNWYRFTTVIDWDTNLVVEVSITDLHTGAEATVDTSADEWYLGGGSAGGTVPTGFRFFAGGGSPGNTVAFDNLSIGPPGEPCPGDVDGDGDTDLADLAALLAVYGGYDPAADFDGDGDVDLTDLAFLLSDYGCVP